ncbi:MAG: hypothetical protein CVU89_04585 [Firmicutes bacterium HGW-Firmicutes-14]|nr:MAG: hypothetical protein CVU89_04585 [Firmicutes bacterium HGW-Firmicutes-14]
MPNTKKKFCLRSFWDTLRLGILSALMNHRLPSGIRVHEETGRAVRLRTYTSSGSHCPVVVLHGITTRGFNDHRLVNFCHVLAAVGFRVYTPDLDGLRNLKITPSDIDLVCRSVQEAYNQNNKKVGIIGFSFGGTYGLIGAASPEIREKVRFVLAAGAYWSLENITHYTFKTPQTDPYARLALMSEELECLNLNSGEKQMYLKIMNEFCARKDRFTPEEQLLIKKITASPALSEVLEHWNQKLKQLSMLSLSGNTYLDDLQAEVLLLHSKGDEVIQVSETEAILAYLKNAGKNAACCLSGNSGHMEYLDGERTGLFGLFYHMMKLKNH